MLRKFPEELDLKELTNVLAAYGAAGIRALCRIVVGASYDYQTVDVANPPPITLALC